MMDRRHAGVTAKTERREQPPAPIKRCPACETEGTLKETRGMILCTHCFWAIELQQPGLPASAPIPTLSQS